MRAPNDALLIPVLLWGCGPAPLLTDTETQFLSELVLEESVPDDPTNAWSNDADAATLGLKLFFDPKFSGPIVLDSSLGAIGEIGKVSCASCHDPAEGGSDHRSGGPTSHGAAWTGRNAPTVVNSALTISTRWVFWDGRKDSLWSQALGPSESPQEHNGSRLQFAHRIFGVYRGEYEAVFGPMPDLSDTTRFPPVEGLCDLTTCLGRPGDAVWEGMTADAQEDVDGVFANFGKAIDAYERLLVTDNSPFDAFMRGDEGALSPDAVRGARLFVGRASCNECHGGPSLSDNEFHNLGVPQMADVAVGLSYQDRGRADGIALVLGDRFNTIGRFSDAPDVASHLAGLAERPEDVGAFKTPTLRNVAQTAPYMHNGAFETLWDVIDFYRFGGRNDGAVGIHDPAVEPLALTDDDVHDLVAFLESLTGSLPEELTTPPELP